MTFGIHQLEYRDDTIPRDISFVPGDCCSVGSLTETSSLTYSEDEGVTTSKRWNCDVGLDPNARHRYSKASQIPVAIPTNHGDPEFFPPLVSMMQSQQSLLPSYHDEDDAENEGIKRRFSCNLFGATNRISTHTRMEMWRHQMSKPFRALPIPTPPRIDAGCIGRNILHSVLNQAPNVGSLDCHKARRLVKEGKKGRDSQSVEKVRFVPAFEDGYPSDEERERGDWERRQSIKDSPTKKKDLPFDSLSPSTSQSFDFSIDKGELSLSNDTHWLSLVATDESSAEESAVVLKLELD